MDDNKPYDREDLKPFHITLPDLTDDESSLPQELEELIAELTATYPDLLQRPRNPKKPFQNFIIVQNGKIIAAQLKFYHDHNTNNYYKKLPRPFVETFVETIFRFLGDLKYLSLDLQYWPYNPLILFGAKCENLQMLQIRLYSHYPKIKWP
ncbi:MAG: hypothetical protein ACTSYU_01305, partial [Promethearchaeota archaeon]